MSTLVAALVALRPRQWVKNFFVFAGLIFSQSLFTPLVWPALGAFLIFCALSGAIYVFNDLADVEKDRLHPTKRYRPIARGRALGARRRWARGAAAGGQPGRGLPLSVPFGVVATAYAGCCTAYSVWLKHMVILDVLTVAAGFVLRAVAGAAAIGVEISGWLVICTILIALFLALGKRRHEYRTLKGDAAAHRPILAEYSESFLDQMVAVVTASTVTAYALYTMSPDTVAKFHTRLLPVTLPFVLYGIFRYLYLLYRREMGGNPSDLLLNDRALMINTVLWMVALLVIIYGPRVGARVDGPVERLSAGPVLEEVAGWGRHPIARGRVARPEHLDLPAGGEPLVPRGLGRAYGDAALPAGPGGLVLESTRADRIRSFDPATGRLHCEAGLSLAEILRVFVPRGWFPPVTPGTKFVTVGACVACDVHGKNHHRDGSFGTFVDRLTLRTADGRLVECGPDRERELFLATLGGMGLTGLIVDVTLRLRRVESPWIVLETQGMASLDVMMEGLRAQRGHWPTRWAGSTAWPGEGRRARRS